MNREIKYRAKRTDGHPAFWAIGYYVKTPITSEFNADGQSFDCGVGRDCIVQDGCAHEVDPQTLGEYTGFKDVLGTEVYEGDILEWHELFHGNMRMVVYWSEREKCFIPPNGCRMSEPRIIGNIYENPDLIEPQYES